MIKIILNYDCEQIIDIENFTLNDVLIEYGVLKNPTSQIIETVLINSNFN